MKIRILTMAGSLAMTWGAFSASIVQWDFNSAPPDTTVATGQNLPSVGIGNAALVGGVSGTFAAGSGNDPAPDNSGWTTAGYPTAAAGNKSAGVEFRASTRGYTNIAISWEQRASASASRLARLQWSANGIEFTDGPVIQLLSNNTFYAQTVSLAGAAAANDNPAFAFRIVTEFERTATGAGADAYVTPLGGSYSGSGTLRFDLVRIDGQPIRPDNRPPVIEPVPDLQTIENVPITGYPLQIGDDATPVDEIVIRAVSSNTNLFRAGDVQIIGSGARREMTLTPRDGEYGQSRITLTASDAESLTSAVSFMVTVAPRNAPPSIAPIAHQRQVMGIPGGPVPVLVADAETPAEVLRVTATSSNPTLIPAEGLVLGGTGEARSLRLQPRAGVAGTARIAVRVEDAGGRRAETAFVLMVVPTTQTLVWETLGYADGSLVTNSAGGWITHGGATGQVQVAAGEVLLSAGRTEDVHMMLPGGPVSDGILYASCLVRFSSLPAGPEYFAHFNHASGFRARVYAGTNQAAPGSFRLGIANGGTSGLSFVPTDLNLDRPYLLVWRYDVVAAAGALWIDPVSESSPPAAATDNVSAVAVQSFSLRNNSGIGAMRISRVRVGRSFGDVIGDPGGSLEITRAGEAIEVSWPLEAAAAGYRLQVNSGSLPGAWVDETAVPTVTGGRQGIRYALSGGQRFFRLVR